MRTFSLFLLFALLACTTTPVPSASPTSTTGETVDIAAWGIAGDRVDFDDPLGFSEINDVQPLGDGFIAVGGDALGGATWHSDDGLGWTKAPADPDLAGGVMRGVTPIGGGLLAWGAMLPFPWVQVPAVWRSVDGRDWQRLGGFPEDAALRSVAAAPGGWVALLVPNDGSGLLVLASPDGIEWAESTPVVAQDESLQAVARGPGGFWAAVSSESGLSTWHSETGLDWQERGVISGPENGPTVFSIAANDTSVVAVGYVQADVTDTNAAAWSSRDGGRTWTMTTIDPVQSTHLYRVDEVEGGFLALGIVSGGPDDAQPVAWASMDGRTWNRLGLGPRDSQVRGLRLRDGAFIAWGLDREGQARVWSSPAPRPAFSDTPHPGIACPVAKPTIRDVVFVPKEDRLACIGGAPISGLAYLPPWEGAGGVCPTVEPTWLVCGANVYFAVDEGPAVRVLPVVVDPAVAFDGAAGPWFRITGQLDHPAAQTCTSTVPAGAAEAARIVADCRSTFVVNSIQPAVGP